MDTVGIDSDCGNYKEVVSIQEGGIYLGGEGMIYGMIYSSAVVGSASGLILFHSMARVPTADKHAVAVAT